MEPRIESSTTLKCCSNRNNMRIRRDHSKQRSTSINASAFLLRFFLLTANLYRPSAAWLSRNLHHRQDFSRLASTTDPISQADSHGNLPTSVPAVDSAISRVDHLRSLERQTKRTTSSSPRDDYFDSHMFDAASAVTKESCRLIGVKSVGVDYGLVRTGVAATVGYDPKPLAILTGLSSTDCCQQIIRYCQSEQASQIVVGLPLHKNGTEAEQTIVTRTFANELAATALRTLGPNVPVVMWDERYTSKFAAARIQSRNGGERMDPRQDLYGTLDADAACIILEHYYSKNGEGHHPVSVPKAQQGECLRAYEASRIENEQAALAAKELRSGGRSTQRQEAMERARQLEAEMAKEGKLGVSRKKKKKKKKMRAKRGPWLTPNDGKGDGMSA